MKPEITKKLLNAVVTEVTNDTFTAWASVEVVDEEGDIIRIDGIDLSYHTPDSPIKLFPEHTYSLELDGKPAVIGRVESLEKTMHPQLNVPALKFSGSWAKDSNGSLTDLSKAWKELYDTGYIDSFSVGLDRVDGKKMAKGVDWLETKLIEISCAAIPANQYANVIKTLKKHNIKVTPMTEEIQKDLNPGTLNTTAIQGDYGTYKKDMGGMMDESMSKCMDHVTKCFSDHAAKMDKCFKDLHDRMDDIESAVSVADDGPSISMSQKALKELEVKKTLEAAQKITEELAALRKSFTAEK